MSEHSCRPACIRLYGLLFIVFAIAFNLPYAWLGMHFDYPNILRSPTGTILEAFAAGGTPLILAWGGFALAALFFAPIAVAMAVVTRKEGHESAAVAALGIAAGITQAIGLSRWVYAVPGLAQQWADAGADPVLRASIETVFMTLHQFAGVGIGEAIGQSLTGFWLIGVALVQFQHPSFGRGVAALGLAGGVILLTGIFEGLATVLAFDPGIFGLSALVGFLILTAWLIWTGILCLQRPGVSA